MTFPFSSYEVKELEAAVAEEPSRTGEGGVDCWGGGGSEDGRDDRLDEVRARFGVGGGELVGQLLGGGDPARADAESGREVHEVGRGIGQVEHSCRRRAGCVA